MDTWVTILLIILAMGMAGIAVYFGMKSTTTDSSDTTTPPSATAVSDRYSCDGVCVPNATGEYSSLADCTVGCQPPPPRYSCNSGRCYEDSAGVYDSLSACNQSCPNLQFVYPVLYGGRRRFGRRHRRRRRP